MKKKLLFYAFAALAGIGTMTVLPSCSSDDDPEVVVYPIDKDLAGTYKGTLKVNMGGVDLATLPQNVSIEKAGNTSVNLKISNFTFPGVGTLGDITLTNVELTQNGSTYTGTHEQQVTLKDPVGTVPTKTTLTVADGKADIALDITWNGAAIKVNYTGTKLTGSESSEAKILEFTFDPADEANAIVTAAVLDEEKKTISITVVDSATTAQLDALKPTIKVSDKATVTPGSGVAQRFSSSVKYTVVAEDGTVAEYTASVAARLISYDFEEDWVTFKGSMYADQTYTLPAGGPWGSTNDGVTSIKGMMSYSAKEWADALPYAVAESSDAHSGKKAVVIKTLDTALPGAASALQAAFGIPYNTAGSLFLGAFETDMEDKLASTKFGIAYEGTEPTVFSGWYKYTPGTTYREGKNVIANKVDQCDIYAVVYEAEDENGKEVTLIGGSNKAENAKYVIMTSPYVVLRAQLADKTAKADWTYFEIPFEAQNGKTFTAGKKYKITFVCTSSADGANYNGGLNSTLVIDDFKILTKAE